MNPTPSFGPPSAMPIDEERRFHRQRLAAARAYSDEWVPNPESPATSPPGIQTTRIGCQLLDDDSVGQQLHLLS